METPPSNSPATVVAASPKPQTTAKQSLPATLAEFVGAPRGGNLRLFLLKLSKTAFSVPSRDDSRAMARNLCTRADGALRLLALLQALGETDGSVRESILVLAEDYLRERGAFPLQPPPLPGNEWRAAIGNLLRPPAPKELKSNLNVFGVFLLLAFHREWLAEDDIVALLETAFLPPQAKRSRSRNVLTKEAQPVEVALKVPFKKSNVAPLLTMHRAWRTRAVGQAAEIAQLKEALQRLESERAAVAAELREARNRITELESTVREQGNQISGLERELTDTRTAAQHRYDSLKGRIRGFLEGELLRWLQNATEAASIEPPRVRVIQERLQSALNGIQKETQCLQSSD